MKRKIFFIVLLAFTFMDFAFAQKAKKAPKPPVNQENGQVNADRTCDVSSNNCNFFGFRLVCCS